MGEQSALTGRSKLPALLQAHLPRPPVARHLAAPAAAPAHSPVPRYSIGMNSSPSSSTISFAACGSVVAALQCSC